MDFKPDNRKEIRYIFTLVLSSVVLVFIFGAVWVLKKFKEGFV